MTPLSAVGRIGAIAAVAFAVVAPAAFADPPYGSPTAHRSGLVQTSAPLSPDNWALRPGPNATPVGPPTVRAGTTGGFDWTDAAVGALATLATGMVGVGGAMYVRRRRHQFAV